MADKVSKRHFFSFPPRQSSLQSAPSAASSGRPLPYTATTDPFRSPTPEPRSTSLAAPQIPGLDFGATTPPKPATTPTKSKRTTPPTPKRTTPTKVKHATPPPRKPLPFSALVPWLDASPPSPRRSKPANPERRASPPAFALPRTPPSRTVSAFSTYTVRAPPSPSPQPLPSAPTHLDSPSTHPDSPALPPAPPGPSTPLPPPTVFQLPLYPAPLTIRKSSPSLLPPAEAAADAPARAAAELVEAVDDLLGQMRARYAHVGKEMLGRMDDMGRRMDALEASLSGKAS